MNDKKANDSVLAAARIRSAAWYAKNRERKLATCAAYRQENPGAYLAGARKSSAKYRASNPDKVGKWRRENKERDKENSRKWRSANKEKLKMYSARYKAHASEKIKRDASLWRERNPGYAAAAWKKWYSENKGRSCAKDAKRRSVKMLAIPAWADLEVIELIYAEAAHRHMTVDHIVPLQGKNVCGLHVHYNMQLLTHSQNSRKRNFF